MNIEFTDNKTVLTGSCDFDLEHIFECGQSFRFDRTIDGFEGIALGKYLRVSQDSGAITLYPCRPIEYKEIWKNYFDLERDYARLFECADGVLQEGLRSAAGLRILNQPPFETLISFIISSNNNVKRIRGIVRRLCERFGRPFEFEGKTYYDFPTPASLAAADSAELAEIGAGYRAPFIVGAARVVCGVRSRPGRTGGVQLDVQAGEQDVHASFKFGGAVVVGENGREAAKSGELA